MKINNNYSKIIVGLCSLFLLVVFMAGTTVAEQLTQDEYLAEVRPGPQDQDFPIELGFVVIDIDTIDGAQQSFIANFAVIATWIDPRLAMNTKYIRTMDTDDIWTPNLQILNQQKLFETFPDQVEVAPNGTVTLGQRYWGTISYPMDLRDFPLDKNTLKIKLVSVGKDARNIKFTIDTERTGMADVLTVTDWEVVNWNAYAEPINLGPNLPVLPGVVFELEAERLVKFYIIKVLVPLIMIVFMSLIVLFIDPVHVGPKFSIAITAILTLIAYRFLLGNLLPKISYLTHMDYFLFGSMFLVFAVLVETCVVARFVSVDKPQQAHELDYWARCAFIVLFVLILVASFLT